ncbi:Ribosomal L40e family protein [Reticulomyxa filosa]|uniref:Ribosomal L40e family protein n=1 Tax=Reticulomyxa filosa TaxID=46433 RepID=X6PCD3_RETFI|nr:Ribosomal L40e family protein [Reticulomyxa filosa]|eukprot:ETO35763.1 Ribosomal L40e family protein [Reticulomyxa filosa]
MSKNPEVIPKNLQLRYNKCKIEVPLQKDFGRFLDDVVSELKKQKEIPEKLKAKLSNKTVALILPPHDDPHTLQLLDFVNDLTHSLSLVKHGKEWDELDIAVEISRTVKIEVTENELAITFLIYFVFAHIYAIALCRYFFCKPGKSTSSAITVEWFKTDGWNELHYLIADACNVYSSEIVLRQNTYKDGEDLTSTIGVTLTRKYDRKGEFQIFVKMFDGHTITVSVSSQMLTEDLMFTIWMRKHISQCRQRIVFSGMQLDMGQPLQNYKIQTASTVHLLSRLRGS